MLRKHQQEMLDIARDEACGVEFTTSIAHVTPGGGKSVLPFILGNELHKRGIIDKILWAVPRLSLTQQAERESEGAFVQSLIGRKMPLERVKNGASLAFGWPADGFGLITTQQAVESASAVYANMVASKRTLVVVDETHHLVEDGLTARAFQPLFDNAAYLLLMSGTLQRNSVTERIAGIDYVETEGGVWKPDLRPGSMDVVYTRQMALQEKAILPIYFERVDGRADWLNIKNQSDEGVESLIGAGDATGKALEAALRTEYAHTLLDRTLESWNRYRQDPNRGNAKVLVVAPNKEQAREYLKYLLSRGLSAGIAISKDRGDSGSMDGDALAAIDRFRKPAQQGGFSVLVSVGMAYEGLDVPAITHIACLTRYRSYPWIEQMLARATRYDKHMGPWEGQAAYVFAPADDAMSDVLKNIRAEQDAVMRKPNLRDLDPNRDVERTPYEPDCIEPISSAVTAVKAEDGQTGEVIGGAEWDDLEAIRQAAGFPGSLEQLKNLFALRESVIADKAAGISPSQNSGAVVSQTTLTQSQRRKSFLKALDTAGKEASRSYTSGAPRHVVASVSKVVNNIINDYLGVQTRKDNSAISLDTLADAASWFNSPSGRQQLREAARLTSQGGSVSTASRRVR